MTKAEFLELMQDGRRAVYVWPYVVQPCSCGDVNCKGWRLAPRVCATSRANYWPATVN